MEEIYLNFEYKYSSCTGDIGGLRYIQRVNVDIFASDADEEEEDVLIGKETLKLVFLNQAFEDGVPFDELMDADPNLSFIGEQVYDPTERDLTAPILDKYMEASLNINICVLDRLVIKPEYRGLGIAKRVIRDAVHQYTGACGLIVMNPFPLQFEDDHCPEADPWEDRSWYSNLEKNEKKAFKKLAAYFQTIDFQPIKGIDDLLFLCPFFKNDKLRKIHLDDTIQMR